MKVFYVCRTGCHTSLLAASLHLGKVGSSIDAHKIFQICGYNKYNRDDIGKPYLAGIDDDDAEVYTIGAAGENHLMIRAAVELIGIMGVSQGDWRIVDTSSVTSNWTIVGQLAERINLDRLCKVFFYLGAKKELSKLKNLARNNRMQNITEHR